MFKLLVRQKIHRHVWILGFVSLLTDTASKIIQSLLPLFLVSVLGVNLVTVGTIEGIAESTASIISTANPLKWQTLKNFDRGYWLLLSVILIFNLGNSSNAFLLLRSQQVGIENTFIPLSFMVMNGTYFVTAYPIGAISDYLGNTDAKESIRKK